MPSEPDSETIHVPASVRFPVELEPPEGFRPEEPASWPRIDGRLEWVGGRLLYIELGRREEGEPELREKARWYLGHGVAVVWLVLPKIREVVVVTASGETRHTTGDWLPPHPLPGLEPPVERFFRQLDPPPPAP